MNILENIRNALGTINSNKMRSGLTMLGIIIGVASVVLMVAIGQGAQQSVTSRIQSLGTNLILISPGNPNQTNVRGAGGGSSTTTLSMDDVTAIRNNVPDLAGLAPELQSRQQVIAGNRNSQTSIVGTTPDYTTVRNAPVAAGSFITQEQVDQVAKVAVIGSTVVTNLFPGNSNPIGSDLRIGNNIFTVIGILRTKGQQGITNADDMIIIPLSTMQTVIRGQNVVGTISVSVSDASAMTATQELITAVLLSTHRIMDTSKQDFTVLNQADAVETLNQVTQVFTLLLGGIAAISLLVGGIGVMNIMLVSVTERTREIGIRKAIGARKRDILTQFLVESTVLSVMGGIIGILLSAGGSWIVKTVWSLNAAISTSSVIMACGFSIAVGIFFGMLPAWKAATLRPMEALRYE